MLNLDSTFSWYAMLISAGMGIGLMFWSVAEPVFHYAKPSPMFDVLPNTAQSAQVAMGLTYYGAEGSNGQNPWTIFYWGRWFSWSPFVGMFIERISMGRTVREFIMGVMVYPILLSFLWMSSFGGSALWRQITGGADIASAVR